MGKHIGRHKIPTVYIQGFPVREVRPGYFCVDYQIDRKRHKKCFRNLDDAKVYCHQRRTELRNKGTSALSLTDTLRDDATKAAEILKSTGASLVQAAMEYARRHPATIGETFRDTCDRYVADMLKEDRRPASIADKRTKLARLCLALGDNQTAAMDATDAQEWTVAQGYGNGTARAYIGAFKSVLAFFRDEKRGRRSSDEKPPETWAPEIVARIMAAAEQVTPEIVPALAILFFAGCRPDEVRRLTWEKINLADREIHLDGEITKTRTTRHVHIEDNLLRWLEAYKGTGAGAVSPPLSQQRTYREKAMAAAGVVKWPVDVARHTYATMLYRSTGDAAKVQNALGHFGNADMFARHYKGAPVSSADAKVYWAIKPEAAGSGEIISFRAG